MNNPPAFPGKQKALLIKSEHSDIAKEYEIDQNGMTLRDYFAAKAMQAMLNAGICSAQYEDDAEQAYAMADAMLAAREALAEHAMSEVQRLGQEIEQEQLISDQINYGMSVTQGGKRIDPMSIYKEPEQEPVTHLWECIGRWSAYLVSNGKQANCAPPSWLVDAVNKATTPPQRTWVELTDAEIDEESSDYYEPGYEYGFRKGALWAEAKLKQKNGYAEEKNT